MMMDYSNLIVAVMLVPLLAAIIMALLPCKSVSRVVYEGIHFLSNLAVCVLAVALVVQVGTSGESIDALGLWFHLDPLGCIFIALIGVIALLTGWYSIPYIRHDVEIGHMNAGQVKRYYVFFSLFVFSMLLVALSNNIIMMWAAIEATTLSTVFLVGAYGNKTSLEASWKYIIVCTCGVAFGLYATILVYADAASLMPNAHEAVFWTSLLPYASQFDTMLMQIAFVFAAIGFGTKAGLFPMHTWLPDAHSEAPSPVSALLSGVLLKCAMLIIIRFYTLAVQVVGETFPQMVMLILGILSVCIAAFSVWTQKDLKRKLAYSSCENIGIIALCLGFGGPVGIAAALFHCIFHGFTKALMFCLSGNILMKYGTRDLSVIKGVLKVAPATGVLMICGLFALSGFPPFAMFVSEVMAFIAGIAADRHWVVVILGIALVVVIAAFVIVATNSVLGNKPDNIKKGDVPAFALVPEIIMVGVILWFGIAMPTPVLHSVESATSIVLQSDIAELHDTALMKDIFAALEA
jgi:hydrogenase-4 component F